jgi:DNA/RNA endonuclease G (NUC1)
VDLSGTTHTNVGTGVYLDAVTYTDPTGNYRNATKFVKDYISKANATITVTGYTVVYDGAAHTATATATGVLGESLSGLDVSGTTHTNVGTGVYNDTVTFTDVTGNYKNATRLVTDRISKANITFTVTGYAVRFDGQAHTATATAIGVNGEDLSVGVDLSGTTHTNRGAYTDTVTYTDATGNYTNATKFVKDYIV